MMQKKVVEILAMQAMKIPAPPTLPPPLPQALTAQPPQDPVILMPMTLVYLLSLPLAFAYFLHIKLLRLQIKNKSMKNLINHQNDVIYFKSDDEKTLYNK